MRITDEARELRNQVTKLRPDKRRRYGEDLRRRILHWIARVEAEGGSEIDCSKYLGIKTWRFRTWRQSEARKETTHESMALVPIDTSGMMPSAIVLVAPSGYRIEGVSLTQVVALLRELA